MADQKTSQPAKDNTNSNVIRVGQKKAPEYVRIAERLLISNEELLLGGLGNTIQTVVSVAEILKNRKYVTIKSIETSMVQGNRSTKSKIQIVVKRNPGVKELLEKIEEEIANETEHEKALRRQEEKEHKDE
jgi:DNA-binding protein